ncbi:MAG: DUF4468 domain-containing protein [Cyclobacteriaceae bacterium]|nr:DUF4468 domain-containing protein [Cyclobacteriaceae bacterium]
MKRLTSIILIIIVFNTFGQSVEMTKDELPTYQGVITMTGKDAKQIYGLLKEWVAKNYKSAKDVIQVDDPENGKLVLKGIDKYLIEAAMGVKAENACYHTITLETKPEKFRFTIEVTEVTTGTMNQPMLRDVLLSNPPIKPNGKPYSGAMLNGVLKQKEQHLTHINSLKIGLITTLSRLATIKKDDW